MVVKDRQMEVPEMAWEIDISEGSVHTDVQSYFGMKKPSTQWVDGFFSR